MSLKARVSWVSSSSPWSAPAAPPAVALLDEGNASAEIASAQPPRGVGQALEGTGDAPGQRARGEPRDEQDHRHREQRAKQARRGEAPRGRGLQNAHHPARTRRAHGDDRERDGTPRQGDAPGLRGVDLRGREGRQHPSELGHHPSVQLAQRDVDFQIVVELLEPVGERVLVVPDFADEGRHVAGHPLGGLAPEPTTGAQGKDDAHGQTRHEEDAEEVQVDARVEPAHRSAPSRRRTYPTPRTVLMRRGSLGFRSSLARSLEMWTSIERSKLS